MKNKPGYIDEWKCMHKYGVPLGTFITVTGMSRSDETTQYSTTGVLNEIEDNGLVLYVEDDIMECSWCEPFYDNEIISIERAEIGRAHV